VIDLIINSDISWHIHVIQIRGTYNKLLQISTELEVNFVLHIKYIARETDFRLNWIYDKANLKFLLT
jgi:hypothetical protein